MDGPMVLVVDDEAELVTVACAVLKRANIRAVGAVTVEDALRIWAQRRDEIAVLLTDCVMPGLFGDQVAARFLDQKPELKVLYMSGNLPDALESSAPLEPGVNFLQKPFRPAEMVEAVKRALGKCATASSVTGN